LCVDNLHNKVDGLEFTLQSSQTKINSLHVPLSKKPNKRRETNLYNKPTTRHKLLHADSAHPTTKKKTLTN